MTPGYARKPGIQALRYCPQCGWEDGHPEKGSIECFHCCWEVEATPPPPPEDGGGGKGRKSPHSDAARIAANKAEEVRQIQKARYPDNQPTPRWRR